MNDILYIIWKCNLLMGKPWIPAFMDATWDAPPTQTPFSWHTTKTARDWSEFKASTWPPSSPALNPITHPSDVQKQMFSMDTPLHSWLVPDTTGTPPVSNALSGRSQVWCTVKPSSAGLVPAWAPVGFSGYIQHVIYLSSWNFPSQKSTTVGDPPPPLWGWRDGPQSQQWASYCWRDLWRKLFWLDHLWGHKCLHEKVSHSN